VSANINPLVIDQTLPPAQQVPQVLPVSDGGTQVTNGTVVVSAPTPAGQPVSNPTAIQPVTNTTVGVAAQSAQIVVNPVTAPPAGTALKFTTAEVIPASGGAPQPVNITGTILQVRERLTAPVEVDFSQSVIATTPASNKTVDPNIRLDGIVGGANRGGSGTIAENAPAGTFTATSTNTPGIYIETGAGNDKITGSAGNDFIRAGNGNDTVNAGQGNDIIRLGEGTDTLTMGPGNDVYYITSDQFRDGAPEVKTITDFTTGVDKILIGPTGGGPRLDPLNPGTVSITDGSGNTAFTNATTVNITFGGALTIRVVSSGGGAANVFNRSTDIQFTA